MGEGDVAVLGQDVVLREKDTLNDLLSQLPRKAQLGFSGLKEKWSGRSDKSLIKIISAAKTNDPLKVEYTCMDVDSDSITIGCNLGILFMYNRHAKTLSRFICESKQVPIVCIKLLRNPNFLATGQFNGAVTIFQYEKEKNGHMKVLLKCTVESHHEAPVTSIQWTYDGTKLFTADSGGNVAITVINMDEGKTHTVFICREDSPVTQLSFCHTALLISTLQRTLIWPFNTKKVVQVGKQSRKVFGNFGACFFPPADRQKPTDDDDVLSIYAARPGLRLWKATIDGKVLTTMIFKDSVNKGEPIIETLELAPRTQIPYQSEQKQFGTLITFDNKFLVSWQGSSIWVMDPSTGYIIGCHSNLGYVTDVCACNNELYVLSKGDQNFIRKIVFETTIPCIVVEELDLNQPTEEEEEEEEEEERQSVFQFNDDQDKFDRLSSKMIGAICDVKSKVMEFKPFLSGEGYSTSEGLSDIDTLKNEEVTSDENNIDHVNKAFESSNELPRCDKNTEVTSKQHENVFDHLSHEAFPADIVFEGTSIGRSPKRKKKTSFAKKGNIGTGSIEEESNSTLCLEINQSDLLNDVDRHNHQDTEDVNFFISLNSDVNKQLFNSNSDVNHHGNHVIQNGSLIQNDAAIQNGGTIDIEIDFIDDKVTNKKVENGETVHPVNLQLSFCDSEDEEVKNMTDKFHINNKNTNNIQVFSVDHEENTIRRAEVTLHNLNGNKEADDIQCLINMDNSADDTSLISHENGDMHSTLSDIRSIPDTSVEDMSNTRLIRDEPEFYFTVDDCPKTQVDVRSDDHKQPIACEVEIPPLVQPEVYTDSHDSCNLDGICPQLNIEKVPTSFSSEPISEVQVSNGTGKESCNFSAGVTLNTSIDNGGADALSESNYPIEQCDLTLDSPFNDRDTNVKATRRRSSSSSAVASTEVQQNGSPSHVINVKISHQRQESNVSVASLGERCKEVRGEAVETGTVSPLLGNNSLLGEDDTLEANIQHRKDEHVSIDNFDNFEDSVDDGKLYPISPFPAPQIQTIYSQNSVALSEVSLNHFSDVEESRYEEEVCAGDYDRIDVHHDLIESLDSITDVEDNLCHSPPEYISENELHSSTGPMKMKKRRLKSKHSSYSNSPCSSDMEGRPSHQQPVTADVLQDRLRYLADSWARVELPTCRQIQFVACSDCAVWVIDSHDHIFYAATNTQHYTWKKLDGKAMLLATNQLGTVVWCIDRQKVAYYRTGVKETSPAGNGWEPFERNMHYVAVDHDRVWAIKTNGDIFVRTGVAMQQPSGIRSITVKIASDLVQITCSNGLVWALDIYNHVQIFTGNITSASNQDSDWCELPGITASHVSLGSKSVCWIIDREYGVWFNQDVTLDDDPLGGTWYQLSLGDGQSAESGWFSSILNYFIEGNEPKTIVANEKAGVLILGKQGTVNVAHGHLFGTRWETKVPSQLSPSSWWSCVSASGTDMNRGFIWALQPSGVLFCFKPGSQSYKVEPPTRVVLKYCSAGPRSLWALTAGQDVFIRLGISEALPQGLKWLKVDMVTQENKRLMSLSCGNHVVWAVDYCGSAWFQMGREDRRAGFEPAWISVEGCPLDGNKFTKIAVGPDDRIVWACDDKNTVYARKNITDNFWVGTSWEVVSGTSAKDVAISSNHVWALCPNGDVICRFGVSSSNVMGDYWKKVPGSFEQISVSPSDEIWGIDRQGHLYQRETMLFDGSTLSNRAPSYNDLFSDHNDWEII